MTYDIKHRPFPSDMKTEITKALRKCKDWRESWQVDYLCSVIEHVNNQTTGCGYGVHSPADICDDE